MERQIIENLESGNRVWKRVFCCKRHIPVLHYTWPPAPPPPRLCRMVALSELTNAPFRQNRGGGGALDECTRSSKRDATHPFGTSLTLTCTIIVVLFTRLLIDKQVYFVIVNPNFIVIIPIFSIICELVAPPPPPIHSSHAHTATALVGLNLGVGSISSCLPF